MSGSGQVKTNSNTVALTNGRYKSCLHRAVVHREQERRSLAFFLCPREDRVVRPPAGAGAGERRLYPDFTWADFMRFTQRPLPRRHPHARRLRPLAPPAGLLRRRAGRRPTDDGYPGGPPSRASS
ncbi:hypothetical protein OsJ_18592 [Oryza sativa Japonica Group]|uniref:Isopenicillin N synthase-like Fe(2+) 2OG dioxygenase domain-containing protein n=1 Tax=Oryza sativa subsp. japonica TaxID=39947 RepID=B9FPP2_ORYSJ|nr:hypothetical protein OsJ_18592 [Oryza sativa Japonica Group]